MFNDRGKIIFMVYLLIFIFVFSLNIATSAIIINIRIVYIPS